MSELLQLKLEDFIPSYSHFGDDFREEIFDIYHDEPENVFYKKKEFYKNRLGPIEDKPSKPGMPLKTQYNISRFLSTRTLNDEMLLFHGLGSGKCVFSDTLVSVNDTERRICDIWDENVSTLTNDGIGQWTVPKNKLSTPCLDDKHQLVTGSIINLYRQLVDEQLYIIILSNGYTIKCTGMHKLLSQDYKWKMASQLKGGNLVYTIKKNYYDISVYCTTIKSIEKVNHKGYVYDLEVDKYHNYVANGILTHNTCSAVTISELSRSINPYLKPTLVLVKGGPLKRNFIRELATKCTTGQYIPDNYDSLTRGEKVLRMNRLVSKSYEIHTFETFAKNIIGRASDNYLKREYSDRAIIIDEVHNIRIQPKKKVKDRDSVDIYGNIHHFLHLLDNRKIALLTATPMRDKPEEFASVMNLILPLDNQLPVGKEFTEKFFLDGKLKNITLLKDTVRGRLSYVRSMESGIVRSFKGIIFRDMKKIKIYPSYMSEFQTTGYVAAYNNDTGDEDIGIEDVSEEDEEKKSQGLYDKSRQASLFVFPDGSYGSEGFNTYIKQVGNSYTILQSLKDGLTQNGKATINQIIDNIRKYSCIYADTIDEIIKHPDENTFVYNKYVQGSGAILFGELLKLVGFERTRGRIDMDNDTDTEIRDLSESESESDIDSDREDVDIRELLKSRRKKRVDKIRRIPRFAIITGETVSEVEVDRIIDGVFNDYRNRKGKYIQVIIGSQIIGEGKSLRNVRQIHIQTPHWNNSETEQAIGRGIRAFSHDDLVPEERFVKVYRHASIPSSGVNSINYAMYKISEDKDFKMKQIERVCKEVSVDCALNRGRNRLSTDIDGSRECDYMDCEYKCDREQGDVPEDELISDTYNLYYAEDEIDSVIGITKQLFRKKFSYDFSELMEEFTGISPMIIIRSLKKIIDKSIELVNRYGFQCFLREDHNLYFLVDEVTLPNSFLLGRYAQYPNIKTYYKFEDIVRLSQYTYIEDKIYVLENFDPTDEDDKRQIISQINSLSPGLKEMFLEMAIIGDKLDKSKSRELRKIIIEHFRNYIINLEDKTVSSLLQEDEERLRCLPKDSNSYLDWYDCEDNVEEEIEDVKVEEKVNLELNPYGYYGIMSKKFSKFPFKIMKVEKAQKDSRKNLRGPVCMEMVPKQRIVDIIEDLNSKKIIVKPPIDIVMKDRDKFISEILKYTDKYDSDDLDNMEDEQIKSIYYWYVKAKKKDMCDSLQQWFENNKLMLYEK